MKKELTCIVCPMGCNLEVEIQGSDVVSVTGNTCKRGEEYAKTECINPQRVITTTVKSSEGHIIPVKTDKAVPKDMIFECMKAITAIHPKVERDLNIGDILCEKIGGTDANIVVCAKVQRK